MQVVDIRKYESGDRAFILHSWLLSLRSSGIYRRCPDKILLPHLGKVLESLLERSTILVATDGNRIAGWICYEPARSVVHFAYVKFASRRKGIFKNLLKESGLNDCRISYTFSTYSAFRIGESRGWGYLPIGIAYTI